MLLRSLQNLSRVPVGDCSTESYWPEIQRICDERDIILISDEVICGFGGPVNGLGVKLISLSPANDLCQSHHQRIYASQVVF